MLVSKVGLEAEFLLLNDKDELVVPPSYLDRDGFPLLGEIRGKPADNMPDVVANFMKRKMEIENGLDKDYKISMENIRAVNLETYRKAMREVTIPKKEQVGTVQNIYGINMDEFSDQIIGRNLKIQGINTSCGMHIHFSCSSSVTEIVEDSEYERVTLPISLAEVNGKNSVLKELIKPEIYLYRRKYFSAEKVKKITASVSIITKPVIKYIVEEMDKSFFERFAPKKGYRTKYRKPGFYELKPYGFEYRSLPANAEVISSLPEIVSKAFSLLMNL